MDNKLLNQLNSDASLRLQAVIDTAIDGILTIDERGSVETMNRAAANLFGYSTEEVLGNNINMLMPSPYKQEHDGYIKRYINTRKPHIIGIGREVKGRKKNGEIFPLRLAVSEVQLGEKRIFTGIIHDLTDVKNAEAEILSLNQELEKQNQDLDRIVTDRTEKLAKAVEQLLQINNKLEDEIKERERVEATLLENEIVLKNALNKEKELSELKSRFVSMASHEFRTPLSTILSSIELIEIYSKEEQQPKRERHTNRIKNAVNHLTGILNDFLSLSKLEEGKIAMEPERFVFKDFCQDVIEGIQNQFKEGQELDHSEINADREVFLDKKCLRHILFNLLSNAIKYSKENQAIECHTELYPNELKIMIRDHGIGIPSEDQKHLFTRFFRAGNVENIKGTGLGLNIVLRYINILKGDIKFESKEGLGTTFWVSIPLEN